MSGAPAAGGDDASGDDASGDDVPPAEDDEHALRRRRLLTRVREANRQSRTGPDSPSLGQPG